MKKGEYFKINSVEELKQAYYMFEDRWSYYFKNEIKDFNKGYRNIISDSIGMYLGNDKHISNYNEIKSPLRNINNLNKLI